MRCSAVVASWLGFTPARERELAALFAHPYPAARQKSDERAILEDPSIQLVVSSITPDERAPLGIRVMEHGKDFLSDKPGLTTLAQLADVRQVQSATRRIYIHPVQRALRECGDGAGR